VLVNGHQDEILGVLTGFLEQPGEQRRIPSCCARVRVRGHEIGTALDERIEEYADVSRFLFVQSAVRYNSGNE
jgi:hypothetical protein